MSLRAFPTGPFNSLHWLCLAGLLFVDTFLIAAPPVRRVELIDLDGRAHTPLKNSDAKATVLFFLLPDCPISNAYAPEIKRISTHYALSNVASYVVYVSPDFSAAEAKKHATDYGFDIPVLRDLSFELVEQTGVTIAPEVAVVSPAWQASHQGDSARPARCAGCNTQGNSGSPGDDQIDRLLHPEAKIWNLHTISIGARSCILFVALGC